MKKRILSLVLALVMCLGLLPTAAMAYGMGKPEARQTFVAGSYSTYVVKADGSLWSWGINTRGQLGIGTQEDCSSPTKVMDNVVLVSAGLSHTLAIQSDGSLWAWGQNNVGQVGDSNTNKNFTTPIKVMDNVVAVSAGEVHTLAVQSDGSLWAWGLNSCGQVGDGTTEKRTKPVKVMDDVAAVSAGGTHSLAIKTDGTLWAWGENLNGRLGIGVEDWDAHPTPVKVLDNVAAASAASYRSLAIQTDGTLWAWGAATLGDGTTDVHHEPLKVMDNVAAVSGGSWHSIVRKTDGTLWAWGINKHGELGDGTTKYRTKPVQMLLDNDEQPSAPAPASTTAYQSTQTVNVDGKAVEFACYALKDEAGNLTNYVKLRDLAALLNGTPAQFSVGWDGSVTITTKTAYTADGSEGNTPFSGDRTYSETDAVTKVNGEVADLAAFVLNDDNGGGYTYYQLRDLGKALGFNVGWDGSKIYVETDKPYDPAN